MERATVLLRSLQGWLTKRSGEVVRRWSVSAPRWVVCTRDYVLEDASVVPSSGATRSAEQLLTTQHTRSSQNCLQEQR